MTACSACTNDAQPVKVHGYDLCPRHASGMMTAVLCGDVTPDGYIIAASCGTTVWEELPTKDTVKVSRRETPAFLKHGALPDGEPIDKPDRRGRAPQPLRVGGIPEHRTVKVANQEWRTRG